MGLLEETMKKYRQPKPAAVAKEFHKLNDKDVCAFKMYLKETKLYKDEAMTEAANADEIKAAFQHGLLIVDTDLKAMALTCNADGTVVYLDAEGTAAVTTIEEVTA